MTIQTRNRKKIETKVIRITTPEICVFNMEKCPFRIVHYESQLYWYDKCLLIEKPQPCEQVCSENRCPLKKNGSVTVTWGAQNEKEETQ